MLREILPGCMRGPQERSLRHAVEPHEREEMPTSATLINIFEVPSDVPDEDFVAWWVRARDFLNDRVGVIPTALHRSIRPDAKFRFVNVAQIPDVEAWQAALADPGFPGREMRGRPYPGLYEVVADAEQVRL